MKKIMVFTMVITLFASFVACSTDNKNSSESASSDLTVNSADDMQQSADSASEEEAAEVEVEGLISKKGPYVDVEYCDHELNEKGQVAKAKMKSDGSVYDVSYEYDEADRLIIEIRENASGESVWTYEYDDNGNVIRELQGDRVFENAYTFDDDGKILTKTSVNITSEDLYTIEYTYTYNEDGTIASETQKSPASTYVVEYTYDNKGRVITEKSTKEGETTSNLTNYTYDVVGSYSPKQ